MRFRSRSNAVQADYYYQRTRTRYRNNTGPWVEVSSTTEPDSSSPRGYVYSNNVSRMYDIDPDSPLGNSRQAKPCLHIVDGIFPNDRVTFTADAYQGSFWDAWTITASVPSIVDKLFLAPTGTNLTEFIGGASPWGALGGGQLDWAALANQYDEIFHSFVRSAVSTGENIAEPGLFIEAAKAIISPRKTLIRFVGHVVKNYGKAFRKKNLGHVLKRVASDTSGTYLGYVFGVKPVVSDLQNAFAAHRNVERQLGWLRANQGKYVPIRVRRLVNADDKYAAAETSIYDPIHLNTTRVSGVGSYGISARALVRKDISPTDTYKAYAQYFGIGKVINLAWELIPFSFVVDWVTNTGEFIEKWTRVGIGSPYCAVKDFCVSTAIDEGFKFSLSPGVITSMSAISPTRVDLGTFGTRRYERMLTMPDEVFSADMSGLNSFHYITSGALAIQKLSGFLK